MRFATFIVLSFMLLTACSENTDQPKEPLETNQEDQVTQNSEKDIEISEEEKLIQALPESSEVKDWNLILVNPWMALPEDFDAQVVEVENQQYIDERVVDAWNEWQQAALNAGHRLFLASGYRTVERQETNFNRQLGEYLNEGLSETEALDKTKEYLTEPGHSEHHTGLALDIVDEEWIVAGHGLVPEYDAQASQQWLVDSMGDYGFILRYPEGKEEVTGIQYESWHFRYVGRENAQFMIENSLTLEEYIELLQLRNTTSQLDEEE